MADPRLGADRDDAGRPRGTDRPGRLPGRRRVGETVGIGRPGIVAVRDREHGGARGGLERHGDLPVRHRAEGPDLPFALDHQPGRHRLHAPGRAGLIDGANEHRRDAPPDEPVHEAPRQLRADEPHVEAPRRPERRPDGGLRDLAKRHPDETPGRAAEELPQVPGDRLALPVAVGREHHRAAAPGESAQPRHHVAPVRRDLPGRLPPRVRVETERCGALPPTAGRRKVPQVAEARPDEVALAETALYRPALGGRLDDDERCHYDPRCTRRTYASAAGNR